MGLGSGIRDPRSGIRKKPIPDPGSRGQKGTGSRIRIRNTGSRQQSCPPTTLNCISLRMRCLTFEQFSWRSPPGQQPWPPRTTRHYTSSRMRSLTFAQFSWRSPFLDSNLGLLLLQDIPTLQKFAHALSYFLSNSPGVLPF
jgi:hypothetical protein